MKRVASACLALAALVAGDGARSFAEEQGAAPLRVRSSDIPKRVQIIGRLGKPIGELVTVQGKWIQGKPTDKDLGPYFHVSRIDGKPLKQPVIFHAALVESVFSRRKGGPKNSWDWHIGADGEAPPPQHHDGEQWEVLGVEAGGEFDDMSQEAWDEVGGATMAMAIWSSGFYTRLRFIAVRKMAAKQSAPGKR